MRDPEENDPITDYNGYGLEKKDLWHIVGGIVGSHFPGNKYEIDTLYSGRLIDVLGEAVQKPEFYMKKDIEKSAGEPTSGYIKKAEIEDIRYNPKLDRIVPRQ